MAILHYILGTLIIAGLLMRSAFIAVAVRQMLRLIPRFRERSAEAAFIVTIVAVAQLAAFPPMRAQGNWVIARNGQPIGLSESREIEQAAFGKHPHDVWPGSGWRDDSGYDAMLNKEVFHSDVIERRIEWLDVMIEIVLLGIVMFAMNRQAPIRMQTLKASLQHRL